MKAYFNFTASPVGMLTLVTDDKFLRGIFWGKRTPDEIPMKVDGFIEEQNEIIKRTKKQLQEYFARERQIFDVPIYYEGTDFQKSVWNQLRLIPFGKTLTYGELAKKLGCPKASRAVGAANGRNPLSIIVPCHRVIGANGTLTGFAGGLQNKRCLLDLERDFASH